MKNLILSFLILVFTWASEDFGILSNALSFMNRLPMEQRDRAYIIVLQPSRGTYTVIYPIFSEKP